MTLVTSYLLCVKQVYMSMDKGVAYNLKHEGIAVLVKHLLANVSAYTSISSMYADNLRVLP